MDKLISVIVPIFMIEKYLGICIESIVNQTYNNIEIILVDDGSSDRCFELCDLYAQKDKRIKVIHKKNGGLVSARKEGLLKASGDFIAYVDGDDWVDPDFIETLYNEAVATGADIVCAGFTRNLFSKYVKILNDYPIGIYEGSRLKHLWGNMISFGSYYKPGITTYVWNKLFKRNILLEPQINVDNSISIGEDAAVTYPALLKCTRVSVIDNTSYHYRQREDSMLKKSDGYIAEIQKLKHLYGYMIRWARTADSGIHLMDQVNDYILANIIMRSGGCLAQDSFLVFDSVFYGKKVVICLAGTFGQQLAKHLKEMQYCDVVAWIDDDYWEYRRCCMNVDPFESIANIQFDYVLIAKVDKCIVDDIVKRLTNYGVARERILTVTVPEDKEMLINRFLDEKL